MEPHALLSRREFLKAGLTGLASIAFPFQFTPREPYDFPSGDVGRVASDRVSAIYQEPRFHSGVVRYTRMNEILNLYYELTPEEGPAYNPRWYRVWGGYIHSAHIQRARYQYNPIMDAVPELGQLGEVTVPLVQSYEYSERDGWTPFYELYYETTHWITNVDEGPDKQPWYEITSELDHYRKYWVPADVIRPIMYDEIKPISPEIPHGDKRIEVVLATQTLIAYEFNQPVFTTKISSGLGNREVPVGTRTPVGTYHVTSKMPSKHMGGMETTGAPGGYSLPGVPWTIFFIYDSGVAFHGTYWHDNFGVPMSHGCVNMRNEDSKWLFRWVDPVYEPPTSTSWDSRGFGTRVEVI